MHNLVSILQVSEQEDKTCSSLRGCKLVSVEDKQKNEDNDGRGCGLSLSLSLQHRRSNVSSVSEITETISSSYRRDHDFRNYYDSCSVKPGLDLSISLCGT